MDALHEKRSSAGIEHHFLSGISAFDRDLKRFAITRMIDYQIFNVK
jgi:hypothetical protein